MGTLPLRSQYHLFSLLMLSAKKISYLHFPNKYILIHSPTSPVFLHWSSCMSQLCCLSCHTYNPVIGPKTSPIFCMFSFPTFLGVCGVILMGWWLLQGKISNLIYQCHMGPPRTFFTCCIVWHPSPSLFFLVKTWFYPLWKCLTALLIPGIFCSC